MKTFKQFVTEAERTGVAILPGGFKPPHKGHFEALRHIVNQNNAAAAVVFIGKKDRDGITAEQSKAIWDIYGKYVGVPVTVAVSQITPVKDVYEYAEEVKDRPIFVGAGEEDMARYSYFEKNKETFPNVSLVAIPPQFGRISGTDTRKKIQDNDLESLNFIPDQVHWTDKEVIYKDILGLTVKKVS